MVPSLGRICPAILIYMSRLVLVAFALGVLMALMALESGEIILHVQARCWRHDKHPCLVPDPPLHMDQVLAHLIGAK